MCFFNVISFDFLLNQLEAVGYANRLVFSLLAEVAAFLG